MRSIPTTAYRLPDDGRKWRTLCEDRKQLADWLASYADGDGSSIYPSVGTIAKAFDTWSRAKIFRVLAALKRLKILSKQGYTREHGTRVRALHPEVLSRPGVSNSGAGVSDSTDQEYQIRGAGVADSRGRSRMHYEPEPALPSVPTNYKTTPLPPAGAGERETFFEWCREIIAVQMGRRHRIPNLGAHVGARADDVVASLKRKGFPARIVDPSELRSGNPGVEEEGRAAKRSAAR
jgi:hypothetical protein